MSDTTETFFEKASRRLVERDEALGVLGFDSPDAAMTLGEQVNGKQFVTCRECGAAVHLTSPIEGSPVMIHRAWHRGQA